MILKRFEQPDEIRTFEKGKFEMVRIGGMTFGRASYEPGWRWSLHVGPTTGTSSCQIEHVGIVVSGRATAAMDNGAIIEMGPFSDKSGSRSAFAFGHPRFSTVKLLEGGISKTRSKKKTVQVATGERASVTTV